MGLFYQNFPQMDTYFFFVQVTSFQVLCKLIPMSYFLKIFTKLQVVDPIHEQIKFVQSSMKSTQFEAPSTILLSEQIHC
jgi:hypothetical protein